jgi:hypothetical protein
LLKTKLPRTNSKILSAIIVSFTDAQIYTNFSLVLSPLLDDRRLVTPTLSVLFFSFIATMVEAAMEFETSEDLAIVPSFDGLGIKEDLLRGIYAYGFERPSAVQQRAIKPILEGKASLAYCFLFS